MPTETPTDTWHTQSPDDMTDTQRLIEIAALIASAVRREEERQKREKSGDSA